MSEAREGLIRALRAEHIARLENPMIYNPAFPNVADRMLAFLDAEGFAIVRKQATGKAEPPPTWQGEPTRSETEALAEAFGRMGVDPRRDEDGHEKLASRKE